MKVPVEEERETCLLSISIPTEPVVLFERYSTFTRIQRVVAWVMQFVNNCKSSRKLKETAGKSTLIVTELVVAEKYLVRFAKVTHFASEITLLKARKGLARGSSYYHYTRSSTLTEYFVSVAGNVTQSWITLKYIQSSSLESSI